MPSPIESGAQEGTGCGVPGRTAQTLSALLLSLPTRTSKSSHLVYNLPKMSNESRKTADKSSGKDTVGVSA